MYAVSVVIPIHGWSDFLKPALESILNQRGISFEVICVDDGMSNATTAYLRAQVGRTGNLRVESNIGRGISSALNRGIALATGRFIARMDADDVSLPDRLLTQADYLDAHPRIGVLGTQARVIDARGRTYRKIRVPVGEARVLAALETTSPLIHPTVMLRRDLVRDVGGYRSPFDGAEDYDLWLRLSRYTQIDNLSETLLLYRRHERQTTQKRQFHQARLSARALADHRAERATFRSSAHDDGSPLASERSAAAAQFEQIEFRCLTAAFLVNNGGTLRHSGARYLQRVCAHAVRQGASKSAKQMAFACVRHQMQLARARRWREAFVAAHADLLRWRSYLALSYLRHATILWHSANVSRKVSRSASEGLEDVDPVQT